MFHGSKLVRLDYQQGPLGHRQRLGRNVAGNEKLAPHDTAFRINFDAVIAH